MLIMLVTGGQECPAHYLAHHELERVLIIMIIIIIIIMFVEGG